MSELTLSDRIKVITEDKFSSKNEFYNYRRHLKNTGWHTNDNVTFFLPEERVIIVFVYVRGSRNSEDYRNAINEAKSHLMVFDTDELIFHIVTERKQSNTPEEKVSEDNKLYELDREFEMYVVPNKIKGKDKRAGNNRLAKIRNADVKYGLVFNYVFKNAIANSNQLCVYYVAGSNCTHNLDFRNFDKFDVYSKLESDTRHSDMKYFNHNLIAFNPVLMENKDVWNAESKIVLNLAGPGRFFLPYGGSSHIWLHTGKRNCKVSG